MKTVQKLFCSSVFLLLLSSCVVDEASYECIGVAVEADTKQPLADVTCSMFLDDKLHKEIVTDTTGMFRLDWFGFIRPKEDISFRVTFCKDEYESVEVFGSVRHNYHFNDTVFLKKTTDI